jgi:hypothetical protein
MTDDEIDRILTQHQSLVPSAGFAAQVMAAVERAAVEPAPLPFPWWRVVPGLVALCCVFVATLTIGDVPMIVASTLALHAVAGKWIALALTATVAAQLSTRLVGMGTDL